MKIEGLRPSKHIRGRYLAELEDGSLLKVTEEEVVRFSLYVGRELTEEELPRLKEASETSNARSLAAAVIGRRPLSRRELIKRLTEKGIAPDEAASAADWLEELGVLSDEAYGRSLVRHYSSRGYGRRRIESELYQRGVPRELWDAVLEEAAPPEDGIDRFLEQKLRGRDASDPKEIKRVSDALQRRGYSWSQVREGLLRYGSRLEEDE